MSRKTAAKPPGGAYRLVTQSVRSNSDTNAKRESLDAAVAGSDVAAWLAATQSSREGDKALNALAKFVTAQIAESDAARNLVYCALVLARRAHTHEANVAFGGAVQASIKQRQAHKRNLSAENSNRSKVADDRVLAAFNAWRISVRSQIESRTFAAQKSTYKTSRAPGKRELDRLSRLFKAGRVSEVIPKKA